MHVRLRMLLTSGRVGKVALLGMVMVAMIIPRGEMAFSQGGVPVSTQIPLFTAIDLHPSGFADSKALGISGGQQVGSGTICPGQPCHEHALLWRGSAASAVDLHPSGFISSGATAVTEGEQVGSGVPVGGNVGMIQGPFHALLWRGSAGSVVDLHPKGFTESHALGISSGQQVGYGSLGNPGNEPLNSHHALLWRGSAASVVDLHPGEYVSSSEASAISNGQEVGWGRIAVPSGQTHALLWRGSSGSVVDLHPSGFVNSRANGTSAGQQVGSGRRDGNCIGPPPSYALLWQGSAGSAVDLTPSGYYVPHASATSGKEVVGDNGGWPNRHAILWRGSAGGVVDLHAFLPPGFVNSSATGIDANGNIVGYAERSEYGPTHAFLWKRNASAPPAPALPPDNTAPNGLSSLKSLIITSDEASAFILTDPQGRRTGHDPVHDMTYHDIPGAVYRIDSCEWSQTVVLEVPSRAAGRYTLDAFGGGNFTAYVSAWSVLGHWLTRSFKGTASPGVSSRFTFPGDTAPFASFQASLKIYSASDAFEVNVMFIPGPGGEISPTQQDVTIEVEGHFSATIPAGSFRQIGLVSVFKGVIDGVAIKATLMPAGAGRFSLKIEGAKTTKIEGAKAATPWPWYTANAPNPDSSVKVEVAIGDNGGSVSVKAEYAR